MADPGDALADADSVVPWLEIGGRVAVRAPGRPGGAVDEAECAARRGAASRRSRTATCSDSPSSKLEPDQVAAGKLEQLRRAGPDGQQAAARIDRGPR